MYDQYFVSYNVHSLIHICDDVRNFGNLDSFTCFPFENMSRKFKKNYSKKLPLQQIHNRLHEITNHQMYMTQMEISLDVQNCKWPSTS